MPLSNRKVTLALLYSVFLMFMTGCSSIKVSQDYSAVTPLKNYATYQWLPSNTTDLDSIAAVKERFPFPAQRMEKSFLNHLIHRDAIFVNRSAEAFISYNYELIESRSMEPSTMVSFGWGSRHFGFRNQMPLDYREVVTQEVIWTIDIYNANQKLIWRGQSRELVDSTQSVAESEKHTQMVVDKILNQYPPK